MPKYFFGCRLAVFFLAAAYICVSSAVQGVTITSGPSFTPATNAPLAGLLHLTTDEDSRVNVTVNEGTNSWSRGFYDYSTNHSIPLLGFKPDQTNQIFVTVYDKTRNSQTAPSPLTFITSPLPTNFPHIAVLKRDPSKMDPGDTMMIIHDQDTRKAFISIIDNTGAVIWYAPWTIYDADVRQLDNGDLFIEEQTPLNDFLEINMLGQVVKTWNPPAGYPVNIHDGVPTAHGTILYFSDQSRTVENFPVNDTDPNAALTTATVADQRVVEMSATNEALLNVWSPLDMLDPTRVTYLTYGEYSGSPYGVDNEHANALIEDTNDNTIIVSLRNQNTIFKFNRQGQIKWILAPHAGWNTNFAPYLLTPMGTPFEWSYGQHAPQLTPQDTLLVFDDGSYRSSPYDPPGADQTNYTRAVEYSINETNMEISQVWDSSFAAEDKIYSPIMGKVQWLPKTHDIVVTYSYVTYINESHPSPYSPNATMVRVIEYTHDPVPEVVFDMSLFNYDNTNSTYQGCLAYRSERIADVYVHPAKSVADLTVHEQNQNSILEFSADPAHNYLVQASTDMKHWTTEGSAVQTEVVGDFNFEDLNASQYKARFYRVITQ